jgi:hypothetical protein
MCNRPKNHNFDTNGRELPHPAGHYMIPVDQVDTVIARMQWDKSVLRCFPFVPIGERSACEFAPRPPTTRPPRAPQQRPAPYRPPVRRR